MLMLEGAREATAHEIPKTEGACQPSDAKHVRLLATGVAQPREVARVTEVDLLRLAPPRLASNLGHPGSASRASRGRDNDVLPGFVGAPTVSQLPLTAGTE
jgi:hypothetical protein